MYRLEVHKYVIFDYQCRYFYKSDTLQTLHDSYDYNRFYKFLFG